LAKFWSVIRESTDAPTQDVVEGFVIGKCLQESAEVIFSLATTTSFSRQNALKILTPHNKNTTNTSNLPFH
jgi:hypothetical protein